MLSRMSPVKPPRTRPTRGEVRDRILDAASKVFAAEGFAGATIDAIGQAAGFTKGAVYSNFGSKDELFLALLDREFELRGEQIATALESGGDTTAAAQTLSRSVLDSVHDHADTLRSYAPQFITRGQSNPPGGLLSSQHKQRGIGKCRYDSGEDCRELAAKPTGPEQAS